MNSALSPREIQARLRAGASVPEVAAEAGVEVDRIAGFAIPVMAERDHMTRTALASTVRRRGDSTGHRRLGEIIHDRLQARGLDADTVEWDSWRQNDLKWRLVGLLDDQAASRAAEFIFDSKGRFSIADNSDARWMIGEELPSPRDDPDNENTIDFHDEFALVRAVTQDSTTETSTTSSGKPGDDVPLFESPYETSAHTSELDELYDMLSGVSEDSVRVYLGLEDESSSEVAEAVENFAPSSAADAPDAPLEHSGDTVEQGQNDESEESLAEHLSDHPDLPALEHVEAPSDDDAAPPSSPEGPASGTPDADAPGDDADPGSATQGGDGTPPAPEQDPLVPEEPPSAPKRKPARKRASVPSWDEIMFGGPSRG